MSDVVEGRPEKALERALSPSNSFWVGWNAQTAKATLKMAMTEDI
jgi:hypothetical protein